MKYPAQKMILSSKNNLKKDLSNLIIYILLEHILESFRFSESKLSAFGIEFGNWKIGKASENSVLANGVIPL
jgi:hypothetical protein